MRTDDAIAETHDDVLEPVSRWWLSGTPLETEHQRLMRRRPVPVPWSETTAAALTPEERARLGETWTRRAAAEYLAVSTFAVLAIDLVAAAAPADVLSLCLRAGIDEVRHAELCLRMIEIYGGKRVLPPPGMSSLPDDPGAPRLHQALANTMLVSCVSETYATTVLSATRDLTVDPTAQEVLTSIYSDEVMHARLGWSYLRYALDRGGDDARSPRPRRWCRSRCAASPPWSSASARIGAVTEAVRGHGLMTPAEERQIFSACVREVLVPGFVALGVPSAAARSTTTARPGRRRREGARCARRPRCVLGCVRTTTACTRLPRRDLGRRARGRRRRRMSPTAWSGTSSARPWPAATPGWELFDFAEVGAFEILLAPLRSPRPTARSDRGREGRPRRRRRHAVPGGPRASQRRQLLPPAGPAHRRHRRLHRGRAALALQPAPRRRLRAAAARSTPTYEPLRVRINAQLARGGVVTAIRCARRATAAWPWCGASARPRAATT
jgi:hypothetical protein